MEVEEEERFCWTQERDNELDRLYAITPNYSASSKNRSRARVGTTDWDTISKGIPGSSKKDCAKR